MTTIAYNHNDREIAVDGRTTAGGLIATDKANKVMIRGDGVKFIFTGSTSDFAGFCAEFENGSSASRCFDCSAVVVIGSSVYSASVDCDSKTFFASPKNESFAIGSGGNLALAAMDFGKSASDAVKYAATRDLYTGGKISVVRVD